ncbi:MAG: ATP synthase F1 subunit gamma [Anaerolineae bacterium]|nr:ATP synthase F1 subunit gamma [Anaerolineae bacterium]
MPSIREMRLRIKSVKNIAQVTRAQQTVSASKVRRAIQSAQATKPYADKASELLLHLYQDPVHTTLHPLLTEHAEVKNALVVMISSDRGLAGAYNVNVLRNTLEYFSQFQIPVTFVAVGRKGRDMLVRRRLKVVADFSNMPSPLSFTDVSPIGRFVVDEFLSGAADQVYLSYTDFKNMVRQEPVIKKLLPMDASVHQMETQHTKTAYSYEPDGRELLNEIIPRFTALQVYQAFLSSQASEHAARMVAMRNATDNANELITTLELEYNKVRQQIITNEMLDIVGGANALS